MEELAIAQDGPDEAAELIDEFARGYRFPLDDFQVGGISALIEGRSALVAAPTGAGKTVVGEFAVWYALRRGGKAFYTTPIKALSNQKFNDLVARHGADRVGLLTGDNALNGDAPIVVMTTEVLRNMLYEGSRALTGLHFVVLDEVHYLADRERGAVWEEVIIQLPPSVQLACLSATVSNAEDFGAWLASVRPAEGQAGSCDVVISERRPVPLEHHYAVNGRLYPVFKAGTARQGAARTKARTEAARQALAGVPNPEVLMLERNAGASGRPSRTGRRQYGGVRLNAPRRSEIVGELRKRRWLPALYFIFSRSGCDDAVQQLLRDGVQLTTPQEQARIRDIVDERTGDLRAEDLDALGYGPWAEGLEQGIAAHHAGMVPVFKETVEELFVRGLVKACFATETLALGINMPARTVVIERLEKWNGQRHELLTPGQFTQLTGRAGRRGLDTFGHAVVLYQRDVDFVTVASLVARRTEPLRSSFAPSYNMAVNLLRRHTREEAEKLLARSFAQFQADKTVAGDETRIARNRQALEGYEANLVSEVGDFSSYWALRRELTRLESEGARERRRRQSEAVEKGLSRLHEGDVVALENGTRRPDLVAVVGMSRTGAGVPLISAVTEDRKLVRLGPREFDGPPRKVGWVPLPGAGGPRQAQYRKQVALALREVEPPPSSGADRAAVNPETAARIAALRDELHAHPVHQDPVLSEIEVWARRYDDLLTETERMERHVRRRTGSLVRQFDRIVGTLRDLGYLVGPDEDPSPSAEGLLLAGLYAETDLVLAECIRTGVLDGLSAPELAAVASAFVYETRAKEIPDPVFPTVRIYDAVDEAVGVWEEIVAREEEAGIPPTRSLDAGFADAAWRWASGGDLEETLADVEMTAGDFVRSTKQLADLLRQIRDAAGATPLGDTAHRAAKSIVRGVVAYSSL